MQLLVRPVLQAAMILELTLITPTVRMPLAIMEAVLPDVTSTLNPAVVTIGCTVSGILIQVTEELVPIKKKCKDEFKPKDKDQ